MNSSHSSRSRTVRKTSLRRHQKLACRQVSLIRARSNNPSRRSLERNMGRPKRNIIAAAAETSTPPPALTATQSIARIMKAEGNSLYSCSLPDQKNILVELPSRFRNTIWIKRGGFVLIDTKEADVRQNKIDGEILNVVRDEHLWRKESYW